MAKKGKTNVVTGSIRCDACNVSLNASIWEQHIQGKRHSAAIAHRNIVSECVKRSLFVTGFSSTTSKSELLDYFSKFAPVIDLVMDKRHNKYAIIEMNDVSGANRIFCLTHFYNGARLTVKRRSYKPQVTDTKPRATVNEKRSMDKGVVLERLMSAIDFEEQILLLTQVLAMSEDELNTKMNVCKEMENTIKEFFPNCQCVPYGSNVSRLGVTGCDLDMHLNLNIAINTVNNTRMEDEQLLAALRLDLKHVRHFKNKDFISRVECLDPRRIVQLLSSIIKKYFSGCSNVYPITSARCPIVTFYMTNLYFDCDVSIKSDLGVYNSILIAEYCKYDPRVAHVLFAIRIWAKFNGLCDSKNGKFSSYAITMLSLFYLQNCQPPVIATVETLQSLQDSETRIYRNNWQCTFCMDPTKVPQQCNTDSAGHLLQGFFEFFSKHSLVDQVICLRSGKFVSKEKFLDQMANDNMISDYKSNKLNIQDPFELNINLAGNFTDQVPDEWLAAITKAHGLCTDLEKKEDQPWGLAKLLFTLESGKVPQSQNSRVDCEADPAEDNLLSSTESDTFNSTAAEILETVTEMDAPTINPTTDALETAVETDAATSSVTTDAAVPTNGTGTMDEESNSMEEPSEAQFKNGTHVLDYQTGSRELTNESQIETQLNDTVLTKDVTFQPSLDQIPKENEVKESPSSSNYKHLPINGNQSNVVKQPDVKMFAANPVLVRKTPLLPAPRRTLLEFPPRSPLFYDNTCNAVRRNERFHPYNVQQRNQSNDSYYERYERPPDLHLNRFQHSTQRPYLRPSINFGLATDNFYPARSQLPQQSQSRNVPRFLAKSRTSPLTPISQYFEIVTCPKGLSTGCLRHVTRSISELETQPLPQHQSCRLWSYEVMFNILSTALRMECEVLNEIQSMSECEKTAQIILCKAYYNTWVDRKSARAAVTIDDTDPIVTELRISEYLIKKYPSPSSEPLFIFHCFLLHSEHVQNMKLTVNLELITTMNKEFVNFTTFLKSISQKIFNRLAPNPQ